MDAPTEWTYGGQLNWSSADSLRLAPIGMAVRCIVEALKERAEAANYTLPDILTAPYNPLEIQSTMVNDIQSAITGLLSIVPRYTTYANFYKHDIDILTYGLNDIPTTWTELNIFASTDYPTRIVPVRLGLLREWIYQQYQILNLLRQCVADVWTMGERGYILTTSEWKNYSGGGETQADLNADWKYIGEWDYNLHRGKGGIKNDDGVSAICQSCIDGLKVWNSIDKFENLGVSVDWYYYTEAYYANHDFNDFGDGFTENAYIKKYTTSHTAGNYMIQSNRLPPGELTAPNIAATEGYYILARRAIIKFDGENGFKFRDW